MSENILSDVNHTIFEGEHDEVSIASKSLRWLIQLHTNALRQKDVASPQNDVEILMAWYLRISRPDLRILLANSSTIEEAFSESDVFNLSQHLWQFEQLIEQRAKRVPLQRLTGETFFYGLRFKTSPKVFIPRPETEVLVEKTVDFVSVTKPLRHSQKSPKVLDLCTGSGAISLAIKSQIPEAQVWGVDVNNHAVDLARENAKLLKLDVKFLYADVTKTLQLKQVLENCYQVGDSPECNLLKFDVITCNPPYIPDNSEVSTEAKMDPQLALYGKGDDGFEIPRKIIQVVSDLELLANGGKFYMEHHELQPQIAYEAFRNAGYTNIEHFVDLNNVIRFTSAQNHSLTTKP